LVAFLSLFTPLIRRGIGKSNPASHGSQSHMKGGEPVLEKWEKSDVQLDINSLKGGKK
jgi:hypothetical protein